MESATKIYECRKLISDFFNVGAPERVAFTMNTTHAINMLVKGLLMQGDHVIISDLEHNSVWRPIYKWLTRVS
jgi:selenocysteine lyase/cysteine desulfurase